MNVIKLILVPALMISLMSMSGSQAFAAGADFDEDGDIDITDIDLLVAAIASNSSDMAYDLNNDASISRGDVREWLSIGGQSNIGADYLEADANLDGTVNEVDFEAWSSNSFTETGAWSLGDFNADGLTNGFDFLVWNDIKFTSSSTPNPSPSSVPEPTGLVLLLPVMLWLRRRM